MGDYATTTELKARFEDDRAVAELTDTAESGTPDETVLNEVIDHAEGDIDSQCAARYLIPLDVASNSKLASMIRSATLDLAQYYLYVRHHSATEDIIRLRDQIFEWLELIRKGEVLLPSPETQPSTTSRDPQIHFGVASTGDDSRRIFTRPLQGAL